MGAEASPALRIAPLGKSLSHVSFPFPGSPGLLGPALLPGFASLGLPLAPRTALAVLCYVSPDNPSVQAKHGNMEPKQELSPRRRWKLRDIVTGDRAETQKGRLRPQGNGSQDGCHIFLLAKEA